VTSDDGRWLTATMAQLDQAAAALGTEAKHQAANMPRPETLTLASTHFAQLALIMSHLAWIKVGDPNLLLILKVLMFDYMFRCYIC